MFSAKARYALKVAVILAQEHAWAGSGNSLTVRELAIRGELRPAFLSKVVAELRAAGLLRARKGPGGGVILARPPAEVSLADVVFAIDRIEDFRRCMLDDVPCRGLTSCPMHNACRLIREDALGGTTVADAAQVYATCTAAGAV